MIFLILQNIIFIYKTKHKYSILYSYYVQKIVLYLKINRKENNTFLFSRKSNLKICQMQEVNSRLDTSGLLVEVLHVKINEKCRIKFFRFKTNFQKNQIWKFSQVHKYMIASISIFLKTRSLIKKFYSVIFYLFLHIEFCFSNNSLIYNQQLTIFSSI